MPTVCIGSARFPNKQPLLTCQSMVNAAHGLLFSGFNKYGRNHRVGYRPIVMPLWMSSTWLGPGPIRHYKCKYGTKRTRKECVVLIAVTYLQLNRQDRDTTAACYVLKPLGGGAYMAYNLVKIIHSNCVRK